MSVYNKYHLIGTIIYNCYRNRDSNRKNVFFDSVDVKVIKETIKITKKSL